MIDQFLIAKSYEFFYRKFYKNNNYIFLHSDSSLKICQNFLTTLERKYKGSVGIDYILKFTSFQFTYWKDLVLEQYNKRIIFSYIYGPKAVERFNLRDQEFDYQLEDQRLEVIGEYTKHVKYQPNNTVTFSNSPVRRQFLNQENGLANCTLLSTLFDHRDTSCQVCKYRLECKELLRVNYPKIYTNRGYVRTETTNK